MKEKQLRELRKSYNLDTLSRDDLLDDPKELVKQWLSAAIDFEESEPSAMTLSTADVDGIPSSRTVLLKEIDDGFVFYSNYQSKKAEDMEANNHVSLLLFWKDMERQIRINGTVEKVSEEQSIAYFQSRPKSSQLGAWASPQSEVIVGRSTLEDRMDELRGVYRGRDVLPKPAHWGGYRVLATSYEFWQGRMSRLHDRFRYTFVNDNWEVARIAP